MAVLSHPKPTPDVLPRQPELRVIESRQRAAKLHLLTYIVGNAIFWTLWAAVSISADAWYWWLNRAVCGVDDRARPAPVARIRADDVVRSSHTARPAALSVLAPARTA